jgi:hypothetical protein
MSKLAMFLAGMLLGMFITTFTVLHQRERAIELGPQPGHAVQDDEDWTPCEYLPSHDVENMDESWMMFTFLEMQGKTH